VENYKKPLKIINQKQRADAQESRNPEVLCLWAKATLTKPGQIKTYQQRGPY
jgi:hypothetical protein